MYSNKTLLTKHFFLLMLLIAVFMPWAAKAQETVTVYDGTDPGATTSNNNFIPMYSGYFDEYTKSEFIIPAVKLEDMEGGEISSLKFYISSVSSYGNNSWENTHQKVFLKEVESTTLSAYSGMEGAVVVFDGTFVKPASTDTEFEISFTTNYEYQGGNLLIGIYNTTKGKYHAVTWKGETVTGASASSSNSSSLNNCSFSQKNFIPKTTFTYTAAAGGCGKPTMETPSNITSNSATISWTGGSGTFNVEYKKASEEEWTSKEANYSGTSVELDNLEANTSYQVRVQSICEGNVVSSWATKSFETPCESVTAFPFHENFNDLTTSGQIPGCWNNNDGTTTNDTYKWCYNSSYGGGYEGKCVSFDSYSNSNGNTNFLKTPAMDFPTGKVMQLRFMYKNPAGGDFSVYISTDGGATYTTPLATGLTGQSEWDEKEIILSDHIGQQNVVIVFKGTSNCGYNQNNNRLYLDDVYVEEAPTCPKQNALHVTAVTSSSVTLDWNTGTNDQDHWDVFITTEANVTPNASTTPTVTNTDQKPYTHSGLNPETVYFAFVRARCSDTDQSPWTPACRFVTPQIPVIVDGDHPYDNDFETTNGWLFVNGDRPNQWWYGSAANNTPNGEKAIYISNDGGVSNTYTNTKGVVYATKAFSLAEGVYTFTYDWRAKGNQYYDYIRVALVPASYEIVATDNLPSGLSDSQLPTGWIALDGGSKLNNNDTWSTKTVHEISVAAGEYKMVFVWRNLTTVNNNHQPPAAIDNVNISYITCPRPTSLISSNVEARTATLSWTENGTATGWVLQYAKNADFTTDLVTINNGFTSNGNNISYNLTGLTGETQYYARVKSACESNWSDVVDFTTLPTCEKPTLNYVYYSNTAHSGTVEWTGSADAYEVAYTTSDFDPSDETLQDVTRVQLGSVNTYILQNLTPETKYYIYVQADCGAEDGKSAWSNRAIFTTLATCLEPTGLTTSATSSTITLSWTAGAEGQDAWDIRYKKNTDSEYTYIHLDNHPATSYTITGLNPVTTYGVNVRAWCDENDQSKWGASVNQSYDKSVTTECGAINLPYTCDFEGTTQTVNGCKIPQCWSVIRGYYNSTYSYGIPTIANQSTSSQPIAYPHEGTYCLYFLNSTSSGTSEEYAILPEVSQEYKMNDVQIRFWVRSYSSACTMEIGVMTDPSNASTYVKVEDVDITGTYTEKTVSLNNYSGNGRHIALKCPAASLNQQAFYVDDITVEYIPSCLVPDNLDVDDIEAFEATLTWTPRGEETAWNVQYKKVSDSEWSSPIAVNTTIYTLTGLQRATEYEARVQANCATDDQSDWTNPISFTTECGIWTIDAQNALIENFNGETFPPDCWQKVNFNEMGITNGWLQSFNNPLDNQGAASSDFKYETWLFLPAMHLNGNAFITFDHLFGNGNDYIPSSVMITTNTNINVEDIKTTGFIDTNFTQIWTADASNLPSTRRNEVVSLSSYNDDTVYIAFRYEGTYNYQGKIWYIDNVEVYVNATQTTQLAEGWNWWSTYIEQGNIDGLTMLENSLGHNGSLIMSQGLNVENYYSQVGYDYWWGDLSNIQNEKGYKVKVSGACNATMTGRNVISESHPITIQPNWNWIGYPCTMQQSIDAANFQPSDGDIIVKQGDNSTYYENYGWWPEFTMEPGKSYQYHSTDTETKTMVFSGARGGILPKANRDNTHWTARNFKNYKAVKGIVLIDGVEQFSDRYEIGAFCGDECRASVRAKLFPITNQYVVNLTIGSDLDNSGELITFRIYDHQTQQELGLESTNSLTLDDFEPMGTINNWFQYTFVTPAVSFTKEITGYGNSNGGYYLIASPIDDVDPAEIDGMIATPAENYDFYWFDQTQNLEWINYKSGTFNMVSGMGYLYANKNDVTLTFTGTPIAGPTYEVSLVKDDDADFSGWNLVGNPFAEHTAYIDHDCFVINTNGRAEIIASDTRSIEAMEGAFVIANEDGESLTFSTEAPAKSAMVTLNVNKGRSVIDRAVVRFGEGRQLPKFQLDPSHTKLYIPQGENNFAVVRSASEGEMPISFIAESIGIYTLNFDAKNVEMDYLHLIDNLTGANVDLLVTPSYTFEAKTTDYASRFKLVFVCGDANDDNETFTYYNGSEWVISNIGEATLQVVDVMGRVVSSETVSGNATMNTNSLNTGIYMMRLVNGENVKVQKIVVR